MAIQNPLINLGQLNRLAASVTVPSIPILTVTAAMLGKAAIKVTPQGDATTFIKVLTGAIPSPEPYQLITVRINLVKTLPVAAAYQAQFQQSTILGNVTVRPDVARGTGGLQPFDIINAALMTPDEIDLSGESADFPVTIQGTWYVNSALWSGVSNIVIPA